MDYNRRCPATRPLMMKQSSKVVLQRRLPPAYPLPLLRTPLARQVGQQTRPPAETAAFLKPHLGAPHSVRLFQRQAHLLDPHRLHHCTRALRWSFPPGLIQGFPHSFLWALLLGGLLRTGTLETVEFFSELDAPFRFERPNAVIDNDGKGSLLGRLGGVVEVFAAREPHREVRPAEVVEALQVLLRAEAIEAVQGQWSLHVRQ